MSRILPLVLVLTVVVPASAHRVDEYLQATMVSVERDRVQFSMRLVPGIAVSSGVIATIDTDRDGIISETEQQTYAQRILADLTLGIDGVPLQPQLISAVFPTVEEMKQGLGEIRIEFTASLPPAGTNRRLTLVNHHQSHNAAYLVNCLVPSDPEIRVLAQHRDERQSFYELDYVQSSASVAPYVRWLSSLRGWTGAVGFASIFRRGMRHIADGTDHLLFLLTLLLPAPLLFSGSRWAGFAGVRQSLLQILRVVTAFTIGHSITLALAALGAMHVPSRPIEVLIAVSILVSAVHAIRPIFPGGGAGIAMFFGLIHGLAFATSLGQLELGWWQRVVSLLGFNLGIEAMQLIVVAATMPSLMLMSRTRLYSPLRIVGALFAGCAATGWILDRLLNMHIPVDLFVDALAHHAVWIAGGLFLSSLVCELRYRITDQSFRRYPITLKGNV